MLNIVAIAVVTVVSLASNQGMVAVYYYIERCGVTAPQHVGIY